ncbi:hypothetical protein SUGI_0680270 [Cryptomeria japonica]|nr:hypothetical protein SUGI_0680270 [Cryptomeria japonica]
MPIPASTILRTMVDMQQYPSVNIWSAVITDMSKTVNGAYLASELVIEMCYFFKDGRLDPRKRKNAPLLAMKPNTAAFNIALNAALGFGMAKKAEKLLELMPRVGVKPDATTFTIMIDVYEKNGRRDELIKLKRHIDETPGTLDLQYQKFYSSLLMSHLNFSDLDAASDVILGMLKRAKAARSSLAAAKLVLSAVEMNPQRPSTEVHNAPQVQDELQEKSSASIMIDKVPRQLEGSLESRKIHSNSMIRAEAENLHMQSTVEVSCRELVSQENRILIPNEKAYAKLVKGYLEVDRVSDLADFLIKVHREEGSVSTENSPSAQVIDACIALGWIDRAHDILDEVTAAEVPVGAGVYSSLLKAYCKAQRHTEAAILLKEVRKAGLQLDASCYDDLIELRVSDRDLHGALDLFTEMKEAKISSSTNNYQSLTEFANQSKPDLRIHLLEEVKDDQADAVGVHDWNSVIDFFCKKQLMHDAVKAFKKMKKLGYQPNSQTFYSLVHGYYTAGGKYEEIIMLWTVMKKMASKVSKTGVKPLRFDQELLDNILYVFVRGGFFESALEVISIMEQENMFIDKVKYRQVYLKYHRNLATNKKTRKVQTEVQFTKREQAMAYKRWAGLD